MSGFEADLYVVGHGHKKVSHKASRLSCPTRGKMKLIAEKKIGAMTGSYLKAYKEGSASYGESKLYPPADQGMIKFSIVPYDKEITITI